MALSDRWCSACRVDYRAMYGGAALLYGGIHSQLPTASTSQYDQSLGCWTATDTVHNVPPHITNRALSIRPHLSPSLSAQ